MCAIRGAPRAMPSTSERGRFFCGPAVRQPRNSHNSSRCTPSGGRHGDSEMPRGQQGDGGGCNQDRRLFRDAVEHGHMSTSWLRAAVEQPGLHRKPFSLAFLSSRAGTTSRDLRLKKMSSRRQTDFVVTKLVVGVHLQAAARRGGRAHGNRQNESNVALVIADTQTESRIDH